MAKANKLSHQTRFRRFVFQLSVFTLCLFIFSKAFRHYYDYDFEYPESTQPGRPFNEYIDQNGDFLPYSGYKILQLATTPLSTEFHEFYSNLMQQKQLQSYFKLVHPSAYHVTLTYLKNKTLLNKKQLDILKTEQEFLDASDTQFSSLGNKVFIIKNQEIRLEIDSTPDELGSLLQERQMRWAEKFPDLITHNATSFYITVAYQYRSVPNDDIYEQLNRELQQWDAYPVEIPLDPIEIVLYKDVISYTALLPDLIEEKTDVLDTPS